MKVHPEWFKNWDDEIPFENKGERSKGIINKKIPKGMKEPLGI